VKAPQRLEAAAEECIDFLIGESDLDAAFADVGVADCGRRGYRAGCSREGRRRRC
jgi:hypothetical protein